MTRELQSGIVAKVEAVAAYGLGPDADDAPPVEVADDEADALLASLEEHGLAGAAVVALIDGGIIASDSTAGRVVALHDQVMGTTMGAEITALRVSDLFTDAGIEHRLLGGAPLAHLVYSDPAARSFEDVDVLVPATEIESALDLLTVEGAVRPEPELRPGFDRRFAASVSVELDNVNVNVHRVFCPGPFGVWMKPNDLFVLRGVLGIADVDIPTLDPTDSLLYACYRVALHEVEPTLSDVRDVALLAEASGKLRFDADRFDQSVDRWNGRAVVRRAVKIVEKRLRVSLPETLSTYSYAPVDKAEIAAIQAYLVDGEDGRFGAMAPATLRALPLGDRPAYALAVGLASDAEPVDRLKSLLRRGTEG